MKRNTIYKLCIAGLMAVSLSLLPMSCGKFDQEPQGEWVDGDLSSGSLEGDVFSLYGKMRSSNINAGNVAMAVHSFRSEDAEKGSTASDKPEHGEMYDNFNYTATNSLLSQYYTGNFEMVHAANTAINRYNQIDSSRLTDGDKINNGEMHFYRANANIHYVRAYGEVPK